MSNIGEKLFTKGLLWLMKRIHVNLDPEDPISGSDLFLDVFGRDHLGEGIYESLPLISRELPDHNIKRRLRCYEASIFYCLRFNNLKSLPNVLGDFISVEDFYKDVKYALEFHELWKIYGKCGRLMCNCCPENDQGTSTIRGCRFLN